MATPMQRPLKASIGVAPQTPRLVQGLTIEPSLRRVRSFFGGVPVVDSRRALLVFEPAHHPTYWFPRKDVHADLLQSSDLDSASRPPVEHWTLRVGDRVAGRAAWSYPGAQGERAALKDRLAFEWDKLDSWFEEDDEVFGHPRDPYHRVDVLRSSRRVRVEVEGQVVAETSRPCLLFDRSAGALLHPQARCAPRAARDPRPRPRAAPTRASPCTGRCA